MSGRSATNTTAVAAYGTQGRHERSASSHSHPAPMPTSIVPQRCTAPLKRWMKSVCESGAADDREVADLNEPAVTADVGKEDDADGDGDDVGIQQMREDERGTGDDRGQMALAPGDDARRGRDRDEREMLRPQLRVRAV